MPYGFPSSRVILLDGLILNTKLFSLRKDDEIIETFLV